MYSSLCKIFQPQLISTRVRVLVHSKAQLGLLPYNDASQQPLVKFFSTSIEDEHSFTESYLINSCGLPLETAKSVSKQVHFETPKKPDSVLRLLRNYGFTNAHITKVVRKYPNVLLVNMDKTLLPKFEFLHSIGILGNDLVKFVSLNASFVSASLKNRSLPLYNFLKNVVCSDEKVAKAFMRLGWLVSHDMQKNFSPNIAVLNKLGVPESSRFSLLTSYPGVVLQAHDKFANIAKEVISMGYDPKKSEFIHAMHMFSSLSKSTREHKIEVYKRWGWSENQIGFSLKNCPLFLILSEKKIMNTMNFLVNKMGYQSADIARYPVVLFYHLEKRTIPRCLVYKVLLLKGLLKKELSLSTLLACAEKQFLEKFVTKYQEDIPQLLDIYQGKMSLLELGFSSEEVRGLKKL